MVDESLVVRTTGNLRDGASSEQTRTIPLSAVTGIDRSIGTRNYTLAGAVIGAAGGIALGIMTQESNQTETVDASGLATLLPGIVGTGVSALVGHAITTDQWHRVDDFSLSVAPTGTAGALAVSLDFGF